MPIITREHFLTLIGIVVFALMGTFFFHIFSKFEKLRDFPQNFFKMDKVCIHLSGAVFPEGERNVASDRTVWQVVSLENRLKNYIDWNKMSLSAKVYHGMELFVPFRKLRSGERITIREIQLSNGKILATIPCFLGGLAKKWNTGNKQRLKTLINTIKKDQCMKNYISG